VSGSVMQVGIKNLQTLRVTIAERWNARLACSRPAKSGL